MTRSKTTARAAAALLTAPLLALPAAAQGVLPDLPVIGAPQAGGIGFQPAATSLAEELQWLDGFVLAIITVITLFVTGLLAYCVLRFRRSANPTPARFTHNSPLEITWTVVPILILVSIGAFSLPVLFDQQRIPEGDVTIKVTGYQWFWGYEYPDEEIAFDSYMIGAGVHQLTDEVSAELQQAGYDDGAFKLATDTSVVVPVGRTVVMQVTAGDVIHSWTIPAFGVKQDGIPGRLAQLWFNVDTPGIYFGQCSELCGQAHAYMPITVKAVPQADYDAWVAAMQSDNPPLSW
jgi:cytochrome c oxidase subunit 2